jgi:hypothetical protein
MQKVQEEISDQVLVAEYERALEIIKGLFNK